MGWSGGVGEGKKGERGREGGGREEERESPCTCRETCNYIPMNVVKNMLVFSFSNVSRSPPVRVVDVRVPKVKAGDKLSFLQHRRQKRMY